MFNKIERKSVLIFFFFYENYSYLYVTLRNEQFNLLLAESISLGAESETVRGGWMP